MGELYGEGLVKGVLARHRSLLDTRSAPRNRGNARSLNPEIRMTRTQHVESVLTEHPTVAAAAVFDAPHAVLGMITVAAVVPRHDAVIDEVGLINYVGKRLAASEVPHRLMVLSQLPMRGPGQLDVAGLRERYQSDRPVSREAQTPTEEILQQIWCTILGLDHVGCEESFFELSGQSITAIRLVGRISAMFNVEITVRTIFETRTIEALGKVIDASARNLRRLTAKPRPKHLPLSFAQQRLWFLAQVDGLNVTYNLPFVLRLHGAISTAALADALADVAARHEPLRTIFSVIDGEPCQKVLAPASAVPSLEVRAISEEALDEAIRRAAMRAFDLSDDPPIRACLFSLGADSYALLIVVHHVAADGWSQNVLNRDLAVAYEARLAGSSPRWAALAVQYADYAIWQRELLNDAAQHDSVISRQLDYWTKALSGLPEVLDLPYDRPRPATASYRGGSVRFTISPETYAKIRALALAHNVTVFMLLVASSAVLLTRLGAGADIPLGTTIAGRVDENLNDLVGFFVNTLVLRIDTSGDPAFGDLLARVRETSMAAYANQDVPFDYVVEAMNPIRSLSRQPLFQTMIGFASAAESLPELTGMAVQNQYIVTESSKFDLTIDFAEPDRSGGRPGGLEGILGYATDLFNHETAQTMAARVVQLLDAVAARPYEPISRHDILLDGERGRILATAEDSAPDTPNLTLPALLEEQVLRTPDAVAVVCDGLELSYAELDRRANRLARYLVSRGVAPSDWWLSRCRAASP